MIACGMWHVTCEAVIELRGLTGACYGCLLRRQFTLDYALNIFLQLAAGLKHLHGCGVLHRDLKSDNALVAVRWAGCA